MLTGASKEDPLVNDVQKVSLMHKTARNGQEHAGCLIGGSETQLIIRNIGNKIEVSWDHQIMVYGTNFTVYAKRLLI